jgi:3-oxo-5alpha-steroid 4-dehydrogenase
MKLLSGVDGMIRGMLIEHAGKTISILARKAVILASGGFIHNREMLEFYAPELAACSVPWGSAGDQGIGINMGVSTGAVTLRMNQGFAIAPIYPPEDVISGIVVNGSGRRFLPEDTYHGVLGDAIAYHQGGKAWLITDEASGYKYKQDNFLAVAKADTISTLSKELGFPDGSLENTVSHYNRFAKVGSDPLFKKNANYLRPLESPYTAWDLSVTNAFFPAHTFGGLKTTANSEVINANGEITPKLYAVGRTTAGIPIAPYFASGLSVGDCTFFGRIAGSKASSLESISV